jgi:DNA-binding SARP family transcriptional activator
MPPNAVQPSVPSPAILRLRLLGEPVLLHPDGRIMSPWRPHVALLALLAVAPGGVMSRASLTGMLWPETTDRKARASLRQTLFRLRQDIGDVVRSTGETLHLDTTQIAIDVREFERLLDAGCAGDAAAWYRGAFLTGFCLPGSLSFDHWADRERARLAGRAVTAFAELVDRAAAAGDWTEGVIRAEQWLAIDSCNETAAARLMSLRAQAGDVAGALGFYADFGAHLREELGVEPGAEIRSLGERIRRSPSGFEMPRARGSAVSAPDMPLIGRESEFERLEECWKRALQEKPQFVVLTGEAGIGKTRLAREFASWVQVRGGSALYGRAYAVEQGVPYAALTGALRAALDAPGLRSVDAASLGEISRVLPEITDRFGSDVAPYGSDLETGRLRLLEAVRALFHTLAREAPVLLVVDDLPWSDEATLSALHYLYRRIEAAPILLLGTAREADLSANPAMERMLGMMRRDAPEDALLIPVAPLEAEHIPRFATAFNTTFSAEIDGEALCSALERESGGNPLFLLETLRARREGASSPVSRNSVRSAVAELTGDLHPDARHLLQAAAVLGRAFPLPLAASVAAQPHEQAIAALEQLLQRRLLHRVDYEYDFVHDLLRESVYAALSAERRQMLHQRACERLAPENGEIVGLERASALATHAIEGGLPEQALEWLMRAADRARAVFAGAEAERFLALAAGYARSAAELERVWEHTGDLRRALSRFGDAAVAYHTAITHTESLTASRLKLRIKLLDVACRAGVLTLPTAGSAIDSLLEDARSEGSAYYRDALMASANAYLRAGDTVRAEAHAVNAVQAARTAEEAGPLVRTLLLRVQCGMLVRSLTDPLMLLDEARRIADRSNLGRELCDVETEYATELCRQGRWLDAISGWSRALHHAEAAGAVGALAVAHLNLADVRLRRGEWELYAKHLTHAQTLAEHYDFPHVLGAALVNRALEAWYRDDRARTLAASRYALTTAQSLRLPSAEYAARAILALAHLDAGSEDEARAVLDSATLPDEISHHTWAVDRELGVAARARLAAAGDQLGVARDIVEAALRDAQEPYSVGFLTLELARLEREATPAAARRLVGEAVNLLTPLGAKPLLAWAESM